MAVHIAKAKSYVLALVMVCVLIILLHGEFYKIGIHSRACISLHYFSLHYIWIPVWLRQNTQKFDDYVASTFVQTQRFMYFFSIKYVPTGIDRF